jgi:hypothetical protein
VKAPTPVAQVLAEAREVLGRHPELAKTSTVARADLVGQAQAEMRVGGFIFSADESERAGGTGCSASPSRRFT